MEELRPNAQRGNYALAMIWAVLSLSVIILISEILQITFYSTDSSSEVVDWLIVATGLPSLLYIIALIASAVTFIMWFRRAYYNLRIKTGRTEYTDGWAAGGWFVPFLNLYIPYKIMKELFVKTDQYLYNECEQPYTTRLNKSYVTGWWALWLISGFVGNISFRIEWNASFNADPEVSLFVSIISSLLNIVSAIITIILIKDYMEAEKLFNEVNEDTDIVSVDQL